MSLIEGRCCLVAVPKAASACSVTVAGPACLIKGWFWKMDVVCAAPRIEKRKIKPVAINACFIMFFLAEVLNCGFDFNGKERLFKPPVKAGSNDSDLSTQRRKVAKTQREENKKSITVP